MKYPAGISGPEYAAMEDGYEQGRESMRAECDKAVADALCEFAEYLKVKAKNAEGTVPGTYADGMRNAAVDAELFVGSIRGRWREA